MRVIFATIALIALLVFLFGTGGDKSNSKNSQVNVDATIAATDRYIATYERLQTVKVSKFHWSKGGFDTVMVGSFTLENTNPFPVKDIEITCEDYANSGTLLGKNVRTIYEIVRAKSTKAIRNFNMGFIHSQASRSGCSVSAFKEAS